MSEITGQASDTGFVDRFVWKGLRFNRVKTRESKEVFRYECEDITCGGVLVEYDNGQWMALFSLGLGCYGWSKDSALQEAIGKHIDHLYYLVAKFEAVDRGSVW